MPVGTHIKYGCMDVCGSQQVMFGAFFDCFPPYEGKFCHMSLAHADLPSLTSKLPWEFFVSLSLRHWRYRWAAKPV